MCHFNYQIQDTEEVKTMGPKGVDMPFNINNIDATVAANGVFGITSGILNGIVDVRVLDDPNIQVKLMSRFFLNDLNIQVKLTTKFEITRTFRKKLTPKF